MTNVRIAGFAFVRTMMTEEITKAMGTRLEAFAPRLRIEQWEDERLSPFAARSGPPQNRALKESEPPCPLRTRFQVDRDRIIHSKAFRRLKHKTQVFISPVGDHYRTRMTHTLEVMQVSRTIARALQLNEDLTEAIAMGHDLGHPPFGHNGGSALSELYHGGFWHNRQSVRVATLIEPLNLTAETLDGIARHTGKEQPATLEGQIVKTADRMAYLAHDIDDAIRAGLMAEADLPAEITAVLGHSKSERLDHMVWGMVEASLDQPAIAVTPEIDEAMLALRRWMFQNVYLNPDNRRQAQNVKRLIRGLYEYYVAHPEAISPGIPDDADHERRVVDYIAGMTDRFASERYATLFLPVPYDPAGEPA